MVTPITRLATAAALIAALTVPAAAGLGDGMGGHGWGGKRHTGL